MAINSKRRIPFYLNWRFWVSLIIALVLIFIFSCFFYGVDNVIPVVINPATYVGIAGFVAVIIGGVEWALKIIVPVIEEVRKLRGETDQVKEDLQVAKTEAITAKSTAIQVAQATEERTTFLETTNEAISKQITQVNADYMQISQMHQTLTDTLQEERVYFTQELRALKEDHRREIQELKDTHRAEIGELREQMRRMGAESSNDKQEIIELRKRVQDLEDEVEKLKHENFVLSEENKKLKNLEGTA